MPIQTTSAMSRMLKSYNAEDWTKSANMEIEGVKSFKPDQLGLDEVSKGGSQSFSEMLTDSLAEVNGMQKEADKSIQKLVSGESQNLHETMLKVEKAQIAFKTMNQVRQKVIDAYKEVMRMQV